MGTREPEDLVNPLHRGLVDPAGRPLGRGPLSRRSFVKTSGGILVAVGLGAACNSDIGSISAVGSVQGLITGLDTSANDGGSVLITALDVSGFAPLTVALPVSGDTGVVGGIPVGHYEIQYTAPQGHALAAGEVNPKQIEVLENTLTVVSWTVVAAASVLRVTVTGLAAGSATGGSASVLRTDISGLPLVVIDIPSSGSAERGVAVGSYTVTYAPPFGHDISSGVQNPQNVATASGQTAVAAFAVTPQSGGGFVPPNMVNNASFENDFEGWVSGSFGTPTNVTRDTARAFHGTTSVKKVLPVTGGSDIGGQFYFPFYAGAPWMTIPAQTHDRLWARWYFYFDAPIDGILKFNVWEASGFSTQFGGLYAINGSLRWWFGPEWAGFSASNYVQVGQLSALAGAWHWAEVEYWRVGHPSGQPAAKLYLDGNQITSGSLPPGAAWSNGYVLAGSRASSAQLGTFNLIGVLNGIPANTIAGNVWVDRVALSSAGRIGP